jgi:TonB-dependent starch-binding outer membrane protein SusC
MKKVFTNELLVSHCALFSSARARSVGFNEEVDRFDLLNGDQFTVIANEKRGNANLFTTAAVSGINSDWQDYVFRKGAIQQHNVSLSGGSETTNYFFSLGYTDQESPVIANDMSRHSFRANIDQSFLKKLKMGISLAYTFRRSTV